MPEGHTKTVDHCAVRRARGGALDVHVSPAPSIYRRRTCALLPSYEYDPHIHFTYYIYLHEIRVFPRSRVSPCALWVHHYVPLLLRCSAAAATRAHSLSPLRLYRTS